MFNVFISLIFLFLRLETQITVLAPGTLKNYSFRGIFSLLNTECCIMAQTVTVSLCVIQQLSSVDVLMLLR